MKIPKKLIEFTGHMYLHKKPLWIVYKPDVHKIKGEDVRRVLDIVDTGDILLRRFDGYLNTIFTPGFWGHAGIYIGNNRVVHAISHGTIKEDILNFCRADAICILSVRNIDSIGRHSVSDTACRIASQHIGYDYDFSSTNKKYYCTELVDVLYSHMFDNDYIKKFGKKVLTPDGIRNSQKVSVKLEIKP